MEEAYIARKISTESPIVVPSQASEAASSGLERAIVGDDAGGDDVLRAIVDSVEHALPRSARIALHEIELNGTEIGSDTGEEVLVNRNAQGDDAQAFGLLHGADTEDGEMLALLDQAGKIPALGSEAMQEAGVIGKIDGQVG